MMMEGKAKCYDDRGDESTSPSLKVHARKAQRFRKTLAPRRENGVPSFEFYPRVLNMDAIRPPLVAMTFSAADESPAPDGGEILWL